ncbi:MAG: hypothetical protein J6N46_08365 [Bacteroidales bacterium]|nr:hypothetical protein [Bacteroidales bacterium]
MRPFRFIATTFASIIIVLLGASCASRQVTARLSEIESYIDSRPDSALAAIRQIDTAALRGRAVKAKYSLLHAIALDKNYIDTADTRIIQPAVDWYARHGSPEEKLKANYYLGVSHFNGERYNEAVIAYTKAEEYSKKTDNYWLLGLLCTGLADIFTKTKEYSRSTPYIDKSIEYFERCGITGYVNHQRFRKAQNLVNRREWDKALSYYEDILHNPSITSPLRESIETNYAMALLTSPNPDTQKSLLLLDNVFLEKGSLENYNQYGAYAFTLKEAGREKESADIFRQMRSDCGPDDVYLNYWMHRSLLSEGDYRGAYTLLHSVFLKSDSIDRMSYVNSISHARDEFLSKDNVNKSLTIENNRKKTIIFELLLILLLIVAYMAFWRMRTIHHKEIDRLAATINAYEDEVKRLEFENMSKNSSIEKLNKSKNKARFAFISDLYMIISRKGSSSPEIIAKDIKDKVQELRSNPDAQKDFEYLLDKECDGVMRKLRREFPLLSEDEYRLASFIFAGFDNNFLSVLMNSVSQDSLRMAKSRLKKKIMRSSSEIKDVFLGYF